MNRKDSVLVYMDKSTKKVFCRICSGLRENRHNIADICHQFYRYPDVVLHQCCSYSNSLVGINHWTSEFHFDNSKHISLIYYNNCVFCKHAKRNNSCKRLSDCDINIQSIISEFIKYISEVEERD